MDLGLKNKGHLGVGADADITIYDEQEDKEKEAACQEGAQLNQKGGRRLELGGRGRKGNGGLFERTHRPGGDRNKDKPLRAGEGHLPLYYAVIQESDESPHLPPQVRD